MGNTVIKSLNLAECSRLYPGLVGVPMVKTGPNTTLTTTASSFDIQSTERPWISSTSTPSSSWPLSGSMCPPLWDGLCWPPTKSGSNVVVPCPSFLKGSDTAKHLSRKCLNSGSWEPFFGNLTSFSSCLSDQVLERFNFPREVLEELTFSALHVRILEMVGLILSLISLLVSLLIFWRFRNLWNSRTKIHRNLFIAMVIQVVVRLSLYIDQYFTRGGLIPGYSGIENTAYVCEFFYMALEYAKTAMFLWMFVEGLYLHNMITVAVFQDRLSQSFYYSIGWGCAFFLTVIWAVANYQKFSSVMCWAHYNLDPYYWILEGPRLTVIMLNLIFLLNIMRVLVTKLRESNSSEAVQVRKAVRAAIVLLPLLGITNVIQMIYTPLDKGVVVFAIWSYGTSFLTQFQGFFCALIYCFLNGEVQTSLKRYWRSRGSRGTDKRRQSQVASQNVIKLQSLAAVKPKESYKTAESKDKLQPLINNGHNHSDPLYEHWSEADLDSHHTVDIEHIEIPASYFLQQTNNMVQ